MISLDVRVEAVLELVVMIAVIVVVVLLLVVLVGVLVLEVLVVAGVFADVTVNLEKVVTK